MTPIAHRAGVRTAGEPAMDRLQDLGEKYVVTILDDFSRYGEVKCVRSKQEIGEVDFYVLKRWERQTGHRVKILRTDHGTEFLGILREFVESNGVERQFSSPYVPEQNGRAERLNRTLLEKCRAILL
jgi:transposase InsO family protein